MKVLPSPEKAFVSILLTEDGISKNFGDAPNAPPAIVVASSGMILLMEPQITLFVSLSLSL